MYIGSLACQPCSSVSQSAGHGLVVKASASRAKDPGFNPRLRRGEVSWSSHTSDLNIGTPVAAPGGIGSALRLVGPLSVYCDWVR